MKSETLGRYRIVEELGRGAMGRVFLAHDPRIDRRVAIKTIQIFAALPAADRDQARERFLREARAAGKLSHPGIVTIFDVGEADGVPYLAMEFVEGTTLDAFCRPGSLLPAPVAVEIVARAAEALAFAHRSGVIHRDIKPTNLMRVGETAVKIMDFGLARGAESQITHDGGLLGTPSYMSPEQIRGEPLDGRSDLFSLTAVLYELLGGTKAFPGDSVSAIIYRVVNEEPLELPANDVTVPAPLAALLARGLAKQRERRFPDGDALAAALREAAGSLTTPAPVAGASTRGAPEPADLPPPPRRRHTRRRGRRLAWLAPLVLLLAGGGAAGYVYRDKLLALVEPPPPPEVWLEAAVRTDPPGMPVTLDGIPLDRPAVRFRADGPFGVLEARQGCRTVEHELNPADAAGEIVLVPDPVELELAVDPRVAGAEVRVNGQAAGTGAVRVSLDLCRDNEIRIAAAGHRPAVVTLPAGATPLEARTAVAAIELQPISRGKLLLSDPRVPVAFYVNGDRIARPADGVELPEGRHRVRAVNRELWIDVTQGVEVTGGETSRVALDLPGIAELVVQAFPANCAVYLRRAGGKWTYIDDVPVRHRIAEGRYEVKVVFKPSGEERVREVDLAAGQNPPLRVSFARSG